MKVVWLLIGLVFGVMLGGAGLLYLQHGNAAGRPVNEILFPEKNYFDNGVWVAVSGTLTGKDLGYPNNTYAISCFQEKRECLVSYIQQIGPNQIGRMESPWIIPITKWDLSEVVVDEGSSAFGCLRTVITIDRLAKSVAWVELPVNQTKPACAKSQSTIRKFTIEDSPGWKRLRRATAQ